MFVEVLYRHLMLGVGISSGRMAAVPSEKLDIGSCRAQLLDPARKIRLGQESGSA